MLLEIVYGYLIASLCDFPQLFSSNVVDELGLDYSFESGHKGVELLLDSIDDGVVDLLLGQCDELLSILHVDCDVSSSRQQFKRLTNLKHFYHLGRLLFL
jgi:hypothetical protein